MFRTADATWTSDEIGALVEQVTDWSRVDLIAEREVAVSQLARAMHRSGKRVPEALLGELRRRAVGIELRMKFLSRRLQQTSAIFAERGIPFMLLKGAALGALVDPTFCARPMNDIDILVRPDDVIRASQAIEAAGWVITGDTILHRLLAEAHHLPPFLDPQMPGIRVELHIAHLPDPHPFDFDVSELWETAQLAPAPFVGASVPSLNHLVLHAAIHFAWQHAVSFGAWRTFRLLSTVARLPGFDWQDLTTSAVAARAGTACYWTLRLASRMSGVEVPGDVLQRLAPPTPEWARAALERHFIASLAIGETPPSPSVRLDHALWLAAIRPAWSGHRTSRKWDPENEWGKAYGVASTETGWKRFVRHLSDHRRWTSFVRRTLAG